nr:MAG TPA: hypothetical protein [Caudoviricetes sp.]
MYHAHIGKRPVHIARVALLRHALAVFRHRLNIIRRCIHVKAHARNSVTIIPVYISHCSGGQLDSFKIHVVVPLRAHRNYYRQSRHKLFTPNLAKTIRVMDSIRNRITWQGNVRGTRGSPQWILSLRVIAEIQCSLIDGKQIGIIQHGSQAFSGQFRLR